MKIIRNMNQSGLVRRTLALLLVGGAIAVVAPVSTARAADQPGAAESSANNPEQNKEVVQQLASLRARVEKLEKHRMEPMKCCRLGMKASTGHGRETSKRGSGMTGSNGSAPEGLAQASPASEPSPGAGSEHPMGGGGMGGSMEHGEGMMGGTSASPGAMPMEHKMGGKMGMGGMGGGGMGGGGMEGGTGGAQPQASPSAGMGGMKDEM